MQVTAVLTTLAALAAVISATPLPGVVDKLVAIAKVVGGGAQYGTTQPPVYQPSTSPPSPPPTYQPPANPTYGPSGGDQCHFGAYRCVDSHTLQQCGYVAGNVLQWESFESCQTSTVCTIRGSFVGCDYPNSSQPGYTPSSTWTQPAYIPTSTWTQPQYTPTTPIYQSSAPVYQPSTPVYQPSAPVYQPTQPTYQPPSTATYGPNNGNQCVFGAYQCSDPYTLQQCGYVAGNVLAWRSFETCQTGTVCTIRGSFVGCDYPSKAAGFAAGVDASYGPTTTTQPAYTPPPPTYIPTATAVYTAPPPPVYTPTTTTAVYTAPPPTYAPTTTTAVYSPPPPPTYQPSSPAYGPTSTWTQPSYQPTPTYGPSGGDQCHFGGYRCVDPYTLQQCGYVAGNVLQWESFETCQTGTVCTIHGSFVGCDYPSSN